MRRTDPIHLQQAFDQEALSYDTVWNQDPVAMAMRQAVWNHAHRVFPVHGHILDIGCGVGVDAEWLIRTGRQVTAIDQSPKMIEATRARCATIDARVLRLEALDTLDNVARLDGVLMNFGVINCADLAQISAALARVLPYNTPIVIVSMPRIPPSWLLYQLSRGHVRKTLKRLRANIRLRVGTDWVRTQYLGTHEIRKHFEPWFTVAHREGLGFMLPPPGTGTPEVVEFLTTIERPLRALPGFRRVGDHLLISLRRTRVSSPRRQLPRPVESSP